MKALDAMQQNGCGIRWGLTFTLIELAHMADASQNDRAPRRRAVLEKTHFKLYWSIGDDILSHMTECILHTLTVSAQVVESLPNHWVQTLPVWSWIFQLRHWRVFAVFWPQNCCQWCKYTNNGLLRFNCHIYYVILIICKSWSHDLNVSDSFWAELPSLCPTSPCNIVTPHVQKSRAHACTLYCVFHVTWAGRDCEKCWPTCLKKSSVAYQLANVGLCWQFSTVWLR